MNPFSVYEMHFLAIWLCGQDGKAQAILIITPLLKAVERLRLKLPYLVFPVSEMGMLTSAVCLERPE